MEAESVAAPVGEPVLEREAHGAERDFLPGNALLFLKRHFQRLCAGLEVEL